MKCAKPMKYKKGGMVKCAKCGKAPCACKGKK
jgi:exosome complex RNA-binding protein Csl4